MQDLLYCEKENPNKTKFPTLILVLCAVAGCFSDTYLYLTKIDNTKSEFTKQSFYVFDNFIIKHSFSLAGVK